MRKAFLLFAFFHVANCAYVQHCPSGYQLVCNGECRGTQARIDTSTTQVGSDALSNCKDNQALPIIIHTPEQQDYWAATMKGSADANTYIGLRCNTTTSLWEWVDGSAVDYKPPNYYHTLDNPCTSGQNWAMLNDGQWTIYNTVTVAMTVNIYCWKQVPLPALDKECQLFADDSDDGVCYQIGTAAENWQDAQMSCKKVGANVASIHKQQENSFIRRMAVADGATNGVLLGASFSGKGMDMAWIDGSEWDYQNYAPGFPRKGLGDCLAMDTTSTAGQWMNVDCATKMPVACIRDQDDSTNMICSADTYETQGQIITSPGFPVSATTACDYFLSVEEGKQVQVEIILLEANSCCDTLVIYDGYLGGKVLANLTGEQSNKVYTTTSSNVMRVTWQPNNGVNVLGMAMSFKAYP